MAADISESGGHDCRGDQRSNTKLDADYPLRVLYCGVCSLPTEYCEYMPDVAKCRQWLEKNFPNEFAKLTVGMNIFFSFIKACTPETDACRALF